MTQLTDAERSEAEFLRDNLIVRFEESGDIQSQVDQMFVSDFASRLRHHANSQITFVKIDAHVLSAASDDELVSLYAETINFIYLVGRHQAAEGWRRLQRGGELGSPELRETLPAEALKLLAADPWLKEALSEEDESSTRANSSLKNDINDSKQAPEDSLDTAKSSEENLEKNGSRASAADCDICTKPQLKLHTELLQQINAVLQRSAKTLPALKSLQSAIAQVERADDAEDVGEPRLFILHDSWFGYPAGEKLICVGTLFFHMDLVRVDGILRVANLYLLID
jgi:hypothetical protein